MSVDELNGLSASDISTFTLANVQALSAGQINGLHAAFVSYMTGAAAAYTNDFRRVYALFNSVKADGIMSFEEAKVFLQAVAVSGCTTGEFAALTSIAASINKTEACGASAIVTQLFGNVVFGDGANKTWTGGAKSSVALGNLTGSSSEVQMTRLVAKWFLGSDNPNPNACGIPVTYKAQTGPLFVGTPTYTQVNQGSVGDCYLLSALAAVATVNPSLLQKMVTNVGNGIYVVDFYNGPSNAHDYVTVNSEMATFPSGCTMLSGSPLAFDNGGASGAIWSEVIEKAYVEFRSQTGAANSYATIQGGWDNGLQAITGQTIANYTTSATSSTEQLSALLTTCSKAMAAGNAVMMNDLNPNSTLHLIGHHMYNVLSVDVAAGTVTLDNPFNANSFKNGAGAVFTDSIAALASANCTFHVATGASREF